MQDFPILETFYFITLINFFLPSLVFGRGFSK